MDPSQGGTDRTRITTLGEDLLILIVSFLYPPEILRLSETCKALYDLAALRIVWHNACIRHILNPGYPFPFSFSFPFYFPTTTPASSPLLDPIPTAQLKSATLHAWALAQRWRAGIPGPRRVRYIAGTSGTMVSDVKFVPGRKGRLVVTISKVVWSALTVWVLGEERMGVDQDRELELRNENGNDAAGSRKVCEWSPRGAIFSGFVVNEDPESEATFALSVHLNEEQSVKLLKLVHDDENGAYTMEELHSVDTDMKPVTLAGDLLALSNDVAQSAVWNWRSGTYALLEHASDDPSIVQSNECHQILFAHQSILVARARSIHLFPFPSLKLPSADGGPPPGAHPPLASHSFGWVDGQSVAVCPFLGRSSGSRTTSGKVVDNHAHDHDRGGAGRWHPISILIRGESDDPWSSDAHHLDVYTLDPNPAYASSASSASSSSTPPSTPPDLPSAPPLHTNTTPTISTPTPTPTPPSPPPYIFPPRLRTTIPSLRGSLRCKQIMLGRFGTAVWVMPRSTFPGGLVHDSDIPRDFNLVPPSRGGKHEGVVLAALPGPLNEGGGGAGGGGEGADGGGGGDGEGVVRRRKIFENEFNVSWTSFDYDEVGGRVVLGSSFGRVVILEL